MAHASGQSSNTNAQHVVDICHKPDYLVVVKWKLSACTELQHLLIQHIDA